MFYNKIRFLSSNNIITFNWANSKVLAYNERLTSVTIGPGLASYRYHYCFAHRSILLLFSRSDNNNRINTYPRVHTSSYHVQLSPVMGAPPPSTSPTTPRRRPSSSDNLCCVSLICRTSQLSLQSTIHTRFFSTRKPTANETRTSSAKPQNRYPLSPSSTPAGFPKHHNPHQALHNQALHNHGAAMAPLHQRRKERRANRRLGSLPRRPAR